MGRGEEEEEEERAQGASAAWRKTRGLMKLKVCTAGMAPAKGNHDGGRAAEHALSSPTRYAPSSSAMPVVARP